MGHKWTREGNWDSSVVKREPSQPTANQVPHDTDSRQENKENCGSQQSGNKLASWTFNPFKREKKPAPSTLLTQFHNFEENKRQKRRHQETHQEDQAVEKKPLLLNQSTASASGLHVAEQNESPRKKPIRKPLIAGIDGIENIPGDKVVPISSPKKKPIRIPLIEGVDGIDETLHRKALIAQKHSTTTKPIRKPLIEGIDGIEN